MVYIFYNSLGSFSVSKHHFSYTFTGRFVCGFHFYFLLHLSYFFLCHLAGCEEAREAFYEILCQRLLFFVCLFF